jgi:hypothetical protein
MSNNPVHSNPHVAPEDHPDNNPAYDDAPDEKSTAKAVEAAKNPQAKLVEPVPVKEPAVEAAPVPVDDKVLYPA